MTDKLTQRVIEEFRKKFCGDLRLLSNDEELSRFVTKEVEEFISQALIRQKFQITKELTKR